MEAHRWCRKNEKSLFTLRTDVVREGTGHEKRSADERNYTVASNAKLEIRWTGELRMDLSYPG
jgi:hypothetical protein